MMNDIRRGITQAQFNKDNAAIVVIEVAFCSVILGWVSHSLLVFFISLLAIPFLLFMPRIGSIFTILFCTFWALLAGNIGYSIGGTNLLGGQFNYTAAWIGAIFFGVVAFFIALVCHISGGQHFNDLQ